MKYCGAATAALLSLPSTVLALSPELAELWGDAALNSADVLDSDGCWKLPLSSESELNNLAAALFVTVDTNKDEAEWQNAVMTHNEPASCYYLQIPKSLEFRDRILVIEGESEKNGQAYCVEDLGSPDLPGTSVPMEPTCGAPIAYCGHIMTDRITSNGQFDRIKIRFSCRESCAEGDWVPYTFRAYLSEETYTIDRAAGISDEDGAVAGTDILDQYCDANVNYDDYPSAKRVADCSTGLCPALAERLDSEGHRIHFHSMVVVMVSALGTV